MYRWPSGKFNNSSPERFSAHVPTAHTSRHYVRFSRVRSRGQYGSTEAVRYAVHHIFIRLSNSNLNHCKYVLNGNCYLKICFKSFNLLFVTEGDFSRRCSARSESNRRKMGSHKVNCNSLQNR